MSELVETLLRFYQKDMLESLSDAVISTDMAGRIVTINEAALKLLGCPVGEGHRWSKPGMDETEMWRSHRNGRQS